MDDDLRMSPEKALEEAGRERRGLLKIFIGYAPGVGKTYTMLNEANRRLKYGQDIVIGYVEPHGRDETDRQIGQLQVIPRKKILYNGIELEELDTAAIIARRPQTVLVDELAHTNVPGSVHVKRYEDVEDILKSGINVITTLNIQHLESLNDVVYKITGIKVKETIPDFIVQHADEVVVVDLTPDALQNRLKRGNVYIPDKVPQALKNFFRKGNLNALRELALRQTAEEVDEQLEEYMRKEGIRDNWRTVERIMVCISASPFAKKLIRRGARMASRYKCEWYAVSVKCTNRFVKEPSSNDKKMLISHMQLVKQLGGEVIELEGKSVSEELSRWALDKHITQIVVGYPNRTRLEMLLRGSTTSKLIKRLRNVDIHVISDDT